MLAHIPADQKALLDIEVGTNRTTADVQSSGQLLAAEQLQNIGEVEDVKRSRKRHIYIPRL
jgi:hypothetical protein